MKKDNDIYFELSDGGDIVRLEPIELVKYNSDLDWDRNLVKTNVTVKCGKFSAQYTADFMTVDFEKFKQGLKRIYNDLKGYANFDGLENYLTLRINGDGIGHFNVSVTACDQPGVGGILTFHLSFDQTTILELVNQLDRITKQFPITGNLRIKNE